MTTAMTIDKGIPLPPRRGPPTNRERSRWAAFGVGDSAFFEGGKSTYLSNAANTWGKAQTEHRKFAARSVTENGVLGARVWRVS